MCHARAVIEIEDPVLGVPAETAIARAAALKGLRLLDRGMVLFSRTTTAIAERSLLRLRLWQSSLDPSTKDWIAWARAAAANGELDDPGSAHEYVEKWRAREHV